MAEKKDVGIFMVLWGFTSVYFLLSTSSNVYSFMETIAFVVMGGIFIAVLATIKSDDDFYHNLNPLHLAFTVMCAMGMVGIASLFTTFVVKSQTLAVFSMSTILPTQTLSSMSMLPSSIFTGFLSDALYTCILVATGEELLKLAGFAEIRSKKFYGAKVLAVIVPVGLWATYHGIQAYNNPVMIVPAFFNGLILMGLLWMTKSFLAPIIAHGLYNTVTILLNYIQGTSGVGVGTPMFPSGWGTGDIFPIILAIVWAFFILVPIIKRDSPESSSKYYYS